VEQQHLKSRKCHVANASRRLRPAPRASSILSGRCGRDVKFHGLEPGSFDSGTASRQPAGAGGLDALDDSDHPAKLIHSRTRLTPIPCPPPHTGRVRRLLSSGQYDFQEHPWRTTPKFRFLSSAKDPDLLTEEISPIYLAQTKQLRAAARRMQQEPNTIDEAEELCW